jgi:hypothetical protein
MRNRDVMSAMSKVVTADELFAFWDVLWGTFYLPNDRRPENFGITDAMPSGGVGQFRYPFRRAPAETAGAGVPRGGPGGAQSAGEKQDRRRSPHSRCGT